MSEVEFDRIMDAVRKAVAPAPIDDSLAVLLASVGPPNATNDNVAPPWPMVPCPEGWNVA